MPEQHMKSFILHGREKRDLRDMIHRYGYASVLVTIFQLGLEDEEMDMAANEQAFQDLYDAAEIFLSKRDMI